MCLMTILTPSTTTRSSSIRLMRTLPRWPLLRPLMTIDLVAAFESFASTLTSLRCSAMRLQHFRRKRDDAHELPLTQLAADRAEDAGATRGALQIDQHGGIVIELDVAAIRAAVFLRGAHDDRTNNIALFDAGVRLRLLDRCDDVSPTLPYLRTSRQGRECT